MSEDDIDLDRVITDPKYRRRVIELLNNGKKDDGYAADKVVELKADPGSRKSGD
jgi:hypothetical protein